MRVLFDAHQLGRRQTGNETYVRELLGALRHRPDVALVAAVEAQAMSHPAVRPPIVRRRVPSNGFLRLAALAVAARRADVDLVHSIYFAPILSGRPSVLTLHDISYEIYPQFFTKRELIRNRALIRDSARRASVVVTISEASRSDIIEHYHLREERVVAIPNGVSAEFFARGLPAIREVGNEPLRLLAVGNLQPRKNLVRLLGAVRQIGRELPVTLRVVGPDGYQAGEIRRRLSESTNIEVVGYLPDDELAEEFARADIFVFPSIYEGFGLPVLEAMAVGTPVITTTGGALPEVAGDAAVLVDPLDESGLATAIVRLAGDRQHRIELQAAGRARAASFTWDKAAARLVDVYRQVLG